MQVAAAIVKTSGARGSTAHPTGDPASCQGAVARDSPGHIAGCSPEEPLNASLLLNACAATPPRPSTCSTRRCKAETAVRLKPLTMYKV